MNGNTQIQEIATEQLAFLRKLAEMSADIYDAKGCEIIQAAELAIENRIQSWNAARKESIAKQNDSFRGFPAHDSGKWVVSRKYNSLTKEEQISLNAIIKNFDNFTEGYDHYGQHDFGIVEFNGENWSWKIDYYDKNYEYGSEDPSDIAITKRVMTIMCSSEY
jgi:hypothetical protein